MDRGAEANIMLVFISVIVHVTLVLWHVEKVKHWRAVRSALRSPAGFDGPGEDESEDDPYDVGVNDTDIL